jgi:hypothetical protein
MRVGSGDLAAADAGEGARWAAAAAALPRGDLAAASACASAWAGAAADEGGEVRRAAAVAA